MSTWNYMDVDSEQILDGYPWRFVLDFPKHQDTRVGHNSDVVPVLSTNMTAVMSGVRFLMDIHGGLDRLGSDWNANHIE
jgi:hypothetical protein